MKNINSKDPCPCGSGITFNRCCGIHIKEVQKSTINWMAGFLEENVYPHIEKLKKNSLEEYLNIYKNWLNDPIHKSQEYGTEKCQRLGHIAIMHIEKIISQYDKRLFMKAVRTMALGAIGKLSINDNTICLLGMLRLSTSLICQFCKPNKFAQLTDDSSHGLLCTSEELENLKSDLGQDIARFIGAIYALYLSKLLFRNAGKGKKLDIDYKQDLKVSILLNDLTKNQIINITTPNFLSTETIDRAINVYEKRKRDIQGSRLSGLTIHAPKVDFKSRHKWWCIAIHPRKVVVNYRYLKLKVISYSYLLYPVCSKKQINNLRFFENEFKRRFNMGFEKFIQTCAALFNLIFYEAGYDKLIGSKITNDTIHISSSLKDSNPRSSTAPGFLYELFSQGIISAPKKSFVKNLVEYANYFSEQETLISEKDVSHFIEQFSYKNSMSELDPLLFYTIDENLINLDLLSINDFFELCLRKLTKGDGTIGRLKGAYYENKVRDYLVKNLSLKQRDIVVKPNQGMKISGVDYGDLDFVFRWDNLIVNLDIKSWQKTNKYFRGEYKAIDNRLQKLSEKLRDRVDPRGQKLFEVLLKTKGCEYDDLVGVLNFLCVPSPEFLTFEQSNLWYGDIPRVITPDELIKLLKDEKRFKSLTK